MRARSFRNARKMVVVAAALIAGAAVLPAAAAHASVVLKDTFTRGSVGTPQPLGGSSPDVVQTAGDVWSGRNSGAVYTNGSEATHNGLTSSRYAKVVIACTPPANKTYSLSADLSIQPDNTNTGAQVGIGFNTSAGQGDEILNGDFHMVLYEDGTLQTYIANTTSGPYQQTYTSEPTTGATFSMQFDPQTMQATFRVNNSVLRTATVTAAPAVDQTGMKFDYYAVATVDNFEVTSTPEPAAATLLALGGVGLLLFGRGRRRRI